MAEDKFKRRYRRAEEMFPLVEAYQSGSESRASFCAARKVPISALNYWQTKYRKAHGLSLGKNPSSGFLELSPSTGSIPKASLGATPPEVVMELCFGPDQKLRFYGYPPLDYLGTLLSGVGC